MFSFEGGDKNFFELPGLPEGKQSAPKVVDRMICQYGLFNLGEPGDVERLSKIMTDICNTNLDPMYPSKKYLDWEKPFLSGDFSFVAVKYYEVKQEPRPEVRFEGEERPDESPSSEEDQVPKGRRRQRKAARRSVPE